MLGPHARLNRRDFVRISAAGVGAAAFAGRDRPAAAAILSTR